MINNSTVKRDGIATAVRVGVKPEQPGLTQDQARLRRYKADLSHFEREYGMLSAEFYEKFERGELGDAADFFEWAGLIDIYQHLLQKAESLETA
jgi:hypothetical protein